MARKFLPKHLKCFDYDFIGRDNLLIGFVFGEHTMFMSYAFLSVKFKVEEGENR